MSARPRQARAAPHVAGAIALVAVLAVAAPAFPLSAAPRRSSLLPFGSTQRRGANFFDRVETRDQPRRDNPLWRVHRKAPGAER